LQKLRSPVEVGQIMVVAVEDKGAQGDGIAKLQGFVMFIKGDCEVGDLVNVYVTRVLDKYCFSRVVKSDR
jgi:predicted RNA-binding protein with TRAM domain